MGTIINLLPLVLVASLSLSLSLSLQFEGVEINLDARVGIFITMNPGYAGRTELPESVKALFRPVVVIVPDLEQICEIMLFSEGFLMAKVLETTCTHITQLLYMYEMYFKI